MFCYTPRFLATLVLLSSGWCSVANAQNSQPYVEGAVSGAMEVKLREELAKVGRAPFSDGWGHTARVWTGKTKLVPQGIHSRVEKIYDTVNDGQWKKGWVELDPKSVHLNIENVQKTPGQQEVRFRVVASGQFRGEVEYRNYKHGQQLISVTANGRAEATVTIDMRVYLSDDGTRLNWATEQVDFKYRNVVVDRVGPFGGEAAKILGDAMTGAVEQWFPQRKRDAIEKAKAAVSEALKGDLNVRNDLAKLIRSLK